MIDQFRVTRTPILEFINNGETISAINTVIEERPGLVRISLEAVPVTRIGRALPDWPERISLKPDLHHSKN